MFYVRYHMQMPLKPLVARWKWVSAGTTLAFSPAFKMHYEHNPPHFSENFNSTHLVRVVDLIDLFLSRRLFVAKSNP